MRTTPLSSKILAVAIGNKAFLEKQKGILVVYVSNTIQVFKKKEMRMGMGMGNFACVHADKNNQNQKRNKRCKGYLSVG